MKHLFLMWKYHRMVAWFLVTTVLVLVVRLPFTCVQPIPFYLDFNPGIVLVPAAGVFWGPAGAWGCLAGMLLGDVLMGMWGWLSFFRAVGIFFFALTTQRLWRILCDRPEAERGHAPDWRGVLGFLFVAWPGCFLEAAWLGLGAEVLRLYPFPYFAGIRLVHNLVFVTIFGVALYRVVAREIVPHFGTWQQVMGDDVHMVENPLRSALFICVGSIGACIAGGVAGVLFYRMWPLQPFVLGITCGIWVPLLVVPFLILHLSGFWGRAKGGPRQAEPEFSWE